MGVTPGPEIKTLNIWISLAIIDAVINNAIHKQLIRFNISSQEQV